MPKGQMIYEPKQDRKMDAVTATLLHSMVLTYMIWFRNNIVLTAEGGAAIISA